MPPAILVMIDGLRPEPLLPLARILHIKPHPDWDGHCVDEIFE